MESIFHEKQEGYLCAQHCLNALLQGQYFNAVVLADHAEQLDFEERIAMAESGEDTDEYKRFIEQPSGNMDDSGFFSVQVISRALKVLGLELIAYTSTEPIAIMAQNDPSQMKAYICNYQGHWLTIRKLGNQWFNLNSMLSGPQLISDTHLAMYLAQLIQEGYSIFIVIGNLPSCEAEEILLKNPVVPKPKVTNEQSQVSSKGYVLGSKADDEANILQAARALEITVPSTSRDNKRSEVEIVSEVVRRPRERLIPIRSQGREEIHTIEDDDENTEFQAALQLSIENYKREQDRNLKLRLENSSSNSTFGVLNDVEDEEDAELRKALQLSLECSTPQVPDPENIRLYRLAYLLINSKNSQAENSSKLNT